jgi:hypothetical protein
MDSAINKKSILSTVLVDILALTFIYFVPALSHMLKFPLYYADPMRIALFSILVLTKKENVYIMALSIPLISFLISAHPVFPKFLIVSLELFANVFLIFRFSNVIKNKFLLVFLSLLLSKSLYYLLKFVLIKFAVLDMGLISTPLYIQAILTLVFSTILAFILRRRKLSDQNE